MSLYLIVLFLVIVVIYLFASASKSKSKSNSRISDSNTYIPQDKREFRLEEESKIVEEWNQFQQDRMKPYYEAMSRDEITDDQVYQALLECPSFRVWLKKHHPDAFNWMKHIPE